VWIGEVLSFNSQKTHQVALWLGIRVYACRDVGAEIGMVVAAVGVYVIGAEIGRRIGSSGDGAVTGHNFLLLVRVAGGEPPYPFLGAKNIPNHGRRITGCGGG